MKIAATYISCFLVLSGLSGTAFGSQQQCPAPMPSWAPAAWPNPNPSPKATVQGTMKTVHDVVLQNNLNVLATFMQVQDAKDELTKARTDLLPSLNVGGLLTLTGGMTFAVNTISFLLPFLVPSNWTDLYQEQNAFNAEKASYQVIQLNTVASALSVYFTALSDLRTMQAYEQEAAAYQQIALIKLAECQIGNDSSLDAEQAEADAESAESNATAAESLFAQDYSALANALNYDQDTLIKFDQPDELEDPGFESQTEADLITQAQKAAPEATQLSYLVAAAKDAQWSGLLSFIDSASIGVSAPSGSNNVSFSNPKGSASVGLGPSLYPEYELSSRNIQEIQLQVTQLNATILETVQAGVADLKNSLAQYVLDSAAEANRINTYQQKNAMYQLGNDSYLDVETAITNVTSSSLARIKDQLSKDLVLTTLYRSTLGGPFADIQGCQATQAPTDNSGGFWNWISGIFGGGSDSQTTLIQVCSAPQGATP